MNIQKLPQETGCYLFRNGRGVIIYIGKAKNLKKRAASYFSKIHEDIKTQQLVNEVDSVDYFVTKTESEAFLLEANLIRKHKPKFNIQLRDTRRYASLVVTEEQFPRVVIGRHKKIKGEYFGPFTDAQLRNQLLRALQKTFFIRTCRVMPKRPCLRYHLGLCKAPCSGLQTREEYLENITRAKRFLKGKDKALMHDLTNEMQECSRKQEFERAQEIKQQLQALAFLSERQLIEQEHNRNEDAIHFIRIGEDVRICVFHVRRGVLQEKQEFTIPYAVSFLDEFLKRYYEEHKEHIPRRILIPYPLDDASIAQYLQEKAEHKVEILVPKRGAKRALLDLVKKNIEVQYEEPQLIQESFYRYLGFPVRTLECFDISHFQGTHLVGSMVRFVDGKPDKKNYRRFKIRTIEGIDDFRSMQEVVLRRYARLASESTNKNFSDFPDLVVIDGGKEQLRFARRALHELRTDIPILALAKKHEEIYLPDKETAVRVDTKTRMMQVLMAARDEAHRFGVAYHRLLRSKSSRKS